MKKKYNYDIVKLTDLNDYDYCIKDLINSDSSNNDTYLVEY